MDIEHPDISFIRSTGLTPAQSKCRDIYCPVCGEELSYDDEVYSTKNGKIVGCEHCISRQDACEVFDDGDCI